MQKVKNTIPVYDICSLSGTGQLHDDLIAEHFSDYLKVHPNLHRAHGHSFYHLLLFTKGSGSHTIDFERFPVAIGQIYFMIPGQVHSWEFEGEMDGYVINFSESFFQSFLSDSNYLERFSFWEGITRDNIVQLHGAAIQEAATLLEEVVKEVKGRQPYYADKARLLLLSLFILTSREAESNGKETNDKIKPNLLVLHNFRKLVNQYYTRYKLPKDYAAMLYVTPNHLNALCQDLLGKSAGEIIRERILLEARRQLVNADQNIAETGYHLGFTDNSYFTKFFKKYTGKTPDEFRRGLQMPA